MGKVRNMFLPHEAELILSIPISARLLEDSLIWAWTSNGRFTVKSEYNEAQKVLKVEGRRGEEGGSSDSTGMRDIWRIVWRLNCPNKIKHLFWRACKNILPTKLFMKACGIGKDGACDMCGLGESSVHALWSCRIAEAVWCGTRLNSLIFMTPQVISLILRGKSKIGG